MASKVNLENVAQTILKEMKQYTEKVELEVGREVVRQGDEATEQLQDTIFPNATSSGTAKPMNRRTWENYANSWVNKKVEGTNFASSTIHNKKHYSLTHLLEYGHATRDENTTRAFAHIQPVSDKYSKRLEENIKKIIEKGGKL